MARLLGLLALVALWSMASTAQAEAPLTAREVQGFAESLEEIETLAARYDESAFELDDEADDPAVNPISVALQQMRRQQAFGAFEAAMQRHGFVDAEHWSRVGDRVVRAYLALTMEREAAVARVETQRSLDEIEQDPNLSAEEKQAMRQMMAGALAGMAGMQLAFQSSEADKAVVKEHLALIDRAWRSED